jgi:hypothetical protein
VKPHSLHGPSSRELQALGSSPKEFVGTWGGGRVWYLDFGSNVANDFQAAKRHHLDSFDAGDPLWRLTPFIDIVGEIRGITYRFDWEREWRLPGSMALATEDLAFLFVPENNHTALQAFFESAGEAAPPLLDPTWSMEWMQEALAKMPEPPMRQAAEVGSGDDPDQCSERAGTADFCTICGHSHGQPFPLCGVFHG